MVLLRCISGTQYPEKRNKNQRPEGQSLQPTLNTLNATLQPKKTENQENTIRTHIANRLAKPSTIIARVDDLGQYATSIENSSAIRLASEDIASGTDRRPERIRRDRHHLQNGN